HLPTAAVDSVLIANTYHELSDSHAILRHTWRALRPDGRLVILDRAPAANQEPVARLAEHEAAPDRVEADLRKEGFKIISREDVFIHPTGDAAWWLIVASKS